MNGPARELSAPASISPLFRLALIKGEETSVLLHLRRHAPIDGRDVYGRTPVMIAAMSGRSDICELLVLEGAEVTLRDADGLTAIDLAAQSGHTGIAARLRAAVAVETERVDAVESGGFDQTNEGWEPEEEFQLPADSHLADDDLVALQLAIASHRLRRESDEWEAADISLPVTTDQACAVAIPQAVQATIANGLAAGWLPDDALLAAWPGAKREHRRQLRLLLEVLNIRVVAARPGNPFCSCVRRLLRL